MGSQRLLSVISPFWQGDTGSAQMQTGSEPGCRYRRSSEPGWETLQMNRQTSVSEAQRDKEESWVAPSETKQFCRFRMC